MPTIEIELSDVGLENAIRQLKGYAKKVKRVAKDSMKRLTVEGAEQAKQTAMFMNAYDSGELVNGIVPEFKRDKGIIHSTAGHSAYVEMGTGVVGSNNPNPNGTMPGWKYDVNQHGEAGWNYIGRDGHLHWTKGMPSRPYMYDTAQKIKEAIPETVKEEFKRD